MAPGRLRAAIQLSLERTCVASLQVSNRFKEDSQKRAEDLGHFHPHRVGILTLLDAAIKKLDLPPQVCHPLCRALELVFRVDR